MISCKAKSLTLKDEKWREFHNLIGQETTRLLQLGFPE